ncbi:MAG: ATP-dependent Clp protease proteolytic subunit [Candidatus Levyibacteriota bacterium]
MEEGGGKTQHIWCSVSITKKMEDVFIGFILNQAQKKENISEYVVYLSTLGGSPFSAISLYNFMKSIRQKTTVFNMGMVASAGVPFFLSFQNRIGVPDCSFLIHQTTLPRDVLPQQFNVFDLGIQQSSLEAIDLKTQKIIQKETSTKGAKTLGTTLIKKAMLTSTTYHAADAEKYGFIDKVEAPKIPESDVLYITDQYLSTLPGI